MTLELDGIDNQGDFLKDRSLNQEIANGRAQKYKAIIGHLSCNLNGEAVILNMKNGTYYGVNSVGASIWAAIQVPISFGELQSAIMAEYQVDKETCGRAIRSFLGKMAKEDLIEVVDE